jgi:hypothetical protein
MQADAVLAVPEAPAGLEDRVVIVVQAVADAVVAEAVVRADRRVAEAETAKLTDELERTKESPASRRAFLPVQK